MLWSTFWGGHWQTVPAGHNPTDRALHGLDPVVAGTLSHSSDAGEGGRPSGRAGHAAAPRGLSRGPRPWASDFVQPPPAPVCASSPSSALAQAPRTRS